MNRNSVRSKVQNIASRMNVRPADCEGLHISEDALYRSVLRAVAHGHPEAQGMAREALRLRELKFTRYHS